ncbi:PREDICTED: uncharacterized protein LOC107194371 [Dufourea novaeangliae]|uniref:uncharacterized protein LOC107194371 n=1 Tax=Dufourea novaeangliae TaxID=178035 RepID=UPI000767AA61|nr:PREDICTED: uncharacterized protein LOC107194371 [Dufourea novaeangliae]
MPPCYGGETIIAVSLSRFKRRHIRWDVAGSASSVPNTHDETAKRAGLRSSVVMRPLAIHVAAILLVIGLCQARTSGRDLSKASGSLEDKFATESTVLEAVVEEESKKEDTNEEDQLPILPPIILLDFGNSTEDDNVTSEEKSKRTVNNGLGYGLDKNSVQPRRYNYYFPAGKSGTTVSIEESISPFLPKTIVEKVQPTDQRGQYFRTQQNSYVPQPAGAQAQGQTQTNYQYLNIHQPKGQSTYGLRTKPQTPQTSFATYQNTLSTPKPSVSPYGISNSGYRGNDVPTTTQSPSAYSPTETVRYVTPNPANFASSQSGSFNYARPDAYTGNSQTYAAQRQNIQSTINSHGFGAVSQSVETSTVSPHNYNPRYSSSSQQTQLPNNGPRYTVENGVRYENKVFWKYPDGRVSDVPPATYVETYSSYPQSDQPNKSQGSRTIYEASTATENSVLSQGPVQFPAVSEENVQEPNRFVSSETLPSSLPQQQVYRYGYQNILGQRQNVNQPQQRKPSLVASYSFSSSGRVQSGANGHKVAYESPYQTATSRYMVNSPNPEYTDGYTTEPTVNTTTPVSNFFSSSTESYPRKHNPPSNDLNSYSNLQYSDLLNYNPSISEYIRNPSSILNVRPTFVQAGNSLIPVIILRVDGSSPIQNRATPNINLKALLQQYLIQYANSIQELARPSTYDLGTETNGKVQSPDPGKNPVLDLIRLTQDDARDPPHTYDPNTYVGRSNYEVGNPEVQEAFTDSHYGERSSVRQKVMNVQILDDPRYTSYKIKN